jgi:hypothetical protein
VQRGVTRFPPCPFAFPTWAKVRRSGERASRNSVPIRGPNGARCRPGHCCMDGAKTCPSTTALFLPHPLVCSGSMSRTWHACHHAERGVTDTAVPNELRLLETAPTYPLRTVIPDYDDSSPEKPDREMAKQVDIETGISIRQIRRPELVPPWWRQFLSRRKRESSDGAQARRGIPMSFPD